MLSVLVRPRTDSEPAWEMVVIWLTRDNERIRPSVIPSAAERSVESGLSK